MQNPPRPLQRRQFLQRPQPRHPQSTQTAFVLMLGPQNAGKSTTINKLFGNRGINTPIQEGTTSIQEFSTNFQDQRNLKVIDVPGIGYGHNNVWDAKVLATLKKYLDTDSQLRDCIPNIVVITGRFDDPRLTSVDGPFAKSLRAINLLNARLFDIHSCNVVILLTHFLQGKTAHKARPRLRQNEVMDLVKTHTTFPQMPYIIFGDNEAQAWDLKPLIHPEYGPGCFELDEDTLYPCNLIDLMVKISGGSTKGAMGPEFFKNIFRNRETLFLWRSCSLPLVSTDRRRFRRAFHLLIDCYKDPDTLED